MLKIAIVGNIASGKSTVENIIEQNGFKVYDTDKIAHQILASNTDVTESFGTNDRKEIAKIVFSDSNKLKILESIIHPLVKKKLEEIFSLESSIVFVSVPQLFEAEFDKMFDKIIFVSANEDIRISRLMHRNNLNKEDALKRIKAQDTEQSKIEKSDFIITNNWNYEELEKKVLEILNKINF
jgi:dephospho-CoA kinase